MSQKPLCAAKCLLPLILVFFIPCSADLQFGITVDDNFEFTLLQNQIGGYDQSYIFNGLSGGPVTIPIGGTFIVSAENLDFEDFALSDTMIVVSISDGNRTTYMNSLIYGEGFFVPINLNSSFKEPLNDTQNTSISISQTLRNYTEDDSTMKWIFQRSLQIQDSSGDVTSWFTTKHIQTFSKLDGVITHSYYEKQSYGASSVSISILEYERTNTILAPKTNPTETKIKITWNFSMILIALLFQRKMVKRIKQ